VGEVKNLGKNIAEHFLSGVTELAVKLKEEINGEK